MPQQFSNLPDYFTIKATHLLSLKVFTMKRNKKILLALTTSFHLISCTLDIKKHFIITLRLSGGVHC